MKNETAKIEKEKMIEILKEFIEIEKDKDLLDDTEYWSFYASVDWTMFIMPDGSWHIVHDINIGLLNQDWELAEYETDNLFVVHGGDYGDDGEWSKLMLECKTEESDQKGLR